MRVSLLEFQREALHKAKASDELVHLFETKSFFG